MLLKERDLQEQTQILSNNLRGDPLHQAKNIQDSNLYKVLKGLATGFLSYRDFINYVYKEYNPSTTTDLIDMWEGMVGIPDSCIPIASTIEERRKWVVLKLSGLNITTKAQFERIGQLMGYNITVRAGLEASDYLLTLPGITSDKLPFCILITLDNSFATGGFPLTFPFTLKESAVPDSLYCIFNKIKPAHCVVYFNFTS
jgi:uncharacterized protein YmfQ (DUF2313 family)